TPPSSAVITSMRQNTHSSVTSNPKYGISSPFHIKTMRSFIDGIVTITSGRASSRWDMPNSTLVILQIINLSSNDTSRFVA
ncbi:MAG: hypothetical protein ABIY38_09505, partial [Rhodococcus sp. (in: high G+C Gram-positive bacteria)]